MTNYQKIGFIAGQVFIGLVFGLVGSISVALIFTGFGFVSTGLYTAISFFMIGGYSGIVIGVSLDGRHYLKKASRENEFWRFFLQNIFGLLVGLFAFFLIIRMFPILNTFVNFLAVFLPLAGSIVGFNIGVDKRPTHRP